MKTIEEHARAQARLLLRRFAAQVAGAAHTPDADAVHDLRVSIRRLGQCLRVFGQFFPADGRKRVRRRLRKLMDRAAEVRNRDIALQLLADSGAPPDSAVTGRLGIERRRAEEELVAALERFERRHSARKWRVRLEL
jgi:CHAD domain-containing protein